MQLTLTDLLQLPVLQSAQVVNNGSFDPYRPVSTNSFATRDGRPGLFCSADPHIIAATVKGSDDWHAVCVVSPTSPRPPIDSDPAFNAALSNASQHDCVLLWLHSIEEPEDLQLRFYHELFAYKDDQIEKSRNIQRRLNEIVIGEGTLQQICNELSILTESPVSIKTAHHAVVAFHDVGSPDGARRRVNEAGHIPPDMMHALETADLPSRLLDEVGAFRFGPLPDIDFHSRVIAPIRTDSALWGYISIAECAHRLNILDLHAVEAAANCAALIVWKDRALERRTREQQTQFVSDLLFADQDPETLSTRALFLGYEPAEHYSAIVFESVESSSSAKATSPGTDRWREGLARAVDEYIAAQAGRSLVYSITVGDRVISLWPSHAGDVEHHVPRLVHRIDDTLRLNIRVGLSYSPKPEVSLATTYRHALLALRLTPVTERVATYHGLGLARLIVEDLGMDAAEEFANELLGPLDRYDADRGGDLVETLDHYYRNGRNFGRAAEHLFVHVNTVKYRVRRVHELTGLDPDDPQKSLNFQVALLIRRMKP